MVAFISSWAQGIIVAVIIASIIEMILPEGSSKKYIKVVIGVYILFVIVTPIVNQFSNNSNSIDADSILNFENEENTLEVSSKNLEEKNVTSIKSMYEMNLKSDIKNKIQSKGYIVQEVNVEISDDEKYSINKILVVVSGEQQSEETKDNGSKKKVVTIVEHVEKVKVDISKQNSESKEEKKYTISEKKANNLKEYLSSQYDIAVKNIEIR